jgi:hypothetical protein
VGGCQPGEYRDDRKVGEWTYWDQGGSPMNYADWERKFHQWDWAYDDYSGFPRVRTGRPRPPIATRSPSRSAMRDVPF